MYMSFPHIYPSVGITHIKTFLKDYFIKKVPDVFLADT